MKNWQEGREFVENNIDQMHFFEACDAFKSYIQLTPRNFELYRAFTHEFNVTCSAIQHYRDWKSFYTNRPLPNYLEEMNKAWLEVEGRKEYIGADAWAALLQEHDEELIKEFIEEVSEKTWTQVKSIQDRIKPELFRHLCGKYLAHTDPTAIDIGEVIFTNARYDIEIC